MLSLLLFGLTCTATLIGILIYKEAFTLNTGVALGLVLAAIILMDFEKNTP